jgi:excisionase family DNA binding protein
MAMVTLGEAARLTGLGKTTLARAIKSGRLSAARTDLGSYQIDPSELARIYPFSAPTEAAGATVAATGGPRCTTRSPTRPVRLLARGRCWMPRSLDCGRSANCCGGSSTMCGRIGTGGEVRPSGSL